MHTYSSSFRPNCLGGKVAFVTGGGSGIGKGIARQLLLHGADVVIASRNKRKLDTAAQELSTETGGRCFAVVMDVRDEAQVLSAVRKALEKVSTIDILVNGAGGNFLCSAAELTYKGFRAVLEIDAHGTFIVSKTIFDTCFKPEAHRCTRHLSRTSSRRIINRLPPKIIINISATVHYTAALLQLHAGAAKAAVDALTRHLAVEWGPYNIRVNCIAPGPIRGTVGLSKLSPFGKSSEPAMIEDPAADRDATSRAVDSNRPVHTDMDNEVDEAAVYERLSRYVPLQRLGLPDDVAYATLFLCLPEASLITGACLVVDGGQWMTSGNFTILEPTLSKQWREAPHRSSKL